MRVPDWERADIDPAKVRDYLLSSIHPVGRFKAPFFASLGYALQNWQALRADLLRLARKGPAMPAGRNDYGGKYMTFG